MTLFTSLSAKNFFVYSSQYTVHGPFWDRVVEYLDFFKKLVEHLMFVLVIPILMIIRISFVFFNSCFMSYFLYNGKIKLCMQICDCHLFDAGCLKSSSA